MSNEENRGIRSATLVGRLAYFSFLALELVLRLFPMAFWCLLGRAVGWIAYYILPKYSRRIRHNLRIILGDEVTEEEVWRLTRENFQTVLCNFVAAAKAATMSDAALASHYTIKGKENIMRSLNEGQKGVICVISHMGNWELLARVRVNFMEVPRFGSMYRELDNVLMEKLWLRRRERSGCEMFGKKNSSFATSSQILRDNGMLGILCDQNAGHLGVIVPYFGKNASTTNLPALLQRRTGAALHPTTVRTTGLGKWEVEFGERIEVENKGKDMLLTTTRINHVLAGIGRRSVLDGFWLHNRWKMGLFSPDGKPVPAVFGEYGRPKHPFRFLLAVPDSLAEGLFLLPFIQACCDFRSDSEWNILCPDEQAAFWNTCVHIRGVRRMGEGARGVVALNEDSVTGLDVVFVFNSDASLIPVLKGVGCIEIRSIAGDNAALSGWRNATNLCMPQPAHRMFEIQRLAHIWGVEMTSDVYYPRVREEGAPVDGCVYLSPFSEYDGTGGWTAEDWKKLVLLLPYPCRILALPKYREQAEILSRACGIGMEICPVEEVICVLQAGRMLIGLDGVLPGIASLAGTPAVTLYGSRQPGRWAPVGNGEKSLPANGDAAPVTPETVRDAALLHLAALGWE